MGVIKEHPIAFIILMMFWIFQMPGVLAGSSPEIDSIKFYGELVGALIGAFIISWVGTVIWAVLRGKGTREEMIRKGQIR